MTQTIVFLPGMMCDARLFGPQVEHLRDRHKVQHCSLTGRNTVAALAQDVLSNAPQSFALAGLSMGGIVAMEIMRQAPGRVSRLALMDTNPLAETDHVKVRREPQMEQVRAGNLSAVMRDEMKPLYLDDSVPHKADILDLCMDMAQGLGPDVFIAQSRALQTRRDQSETLRAVTVRALILHGENDALCPPQRHQLMAGLIPGATLVSIPNAGHLPTLENPTAVNTALDAWLAA